MGITIFRPGRRIVIPSPGVQVWTPGIAAAAAYVLDGISNVAAAYSLRKLRSAYAGSAVRVRRSSDSTEQDIGFDGSGEFDSAAFSSFVGGGTGFVKTWYDQSGNGRDLTQATTANQPAITVSAVNSKPALTFDGSNDSLSYGGSITVGSALVLSNYTATSPFGTYAGLVTGPANNDVDIVFVASQGTTMFYESVTTLFRSNIRGSNGGAVTLSYSPLSTHKITSGVAVLTGASALGGIIVGYDRITTSRVWKGDVAELIIKSDLISNADHNAIGANMATRYGLSWTTVT